MREGPVNRLEPHWPQTVARGTVSGEQLAPLGEAAKTWERNVAQFMAAHPKLTMAAAAAIGIMLGWMVKRR